ncbi:ZMAT4 protein, partial [Rhabdornis inornatus]|nr:ZMAT4 protein [Rhabdornis inornatus]
MKSSDIDQELFTESYCKVCSAQLISESQRVAHYESRKHASKVRLYYMLHPIDGGCPAKKLRSENGSDGDSVDKNKCCTLCNMSFTSAVVAESHYQGKIHAKRLKLLLGEQPALKATGAALGSLKAPHTDRAPAVPPQPQQRRDSDRHCQLCTAWFNNPIMAQQHYEGKKHKKNAARADLLEQLGKTLDLGELRGLKRSYTCSICNVTLNSIEQYHAHLKGSKHQAK